MFSHSLQNQARTHTNAWGVSTNPDNTLQTLIQQTLLLSINQHISLYSLVATLDKSRRNHYPPGTAKNVLTIGASTTGMGGTDPLGSVWSNNSGGTLDGRIKPDLVAPGVEICSAGRVKRHRWQVRLFDSN